MNDQLNAIYTQFEACKSWEERYRLLIQFSRQLPKLSAEELATTPEIHGCESRLWFAFQLEPRKVVAYSDARLMQGILWIIGVVLQAKTTEELKDFQLKTLFDELKITAHLTQTRLNGLQQIQGLINDSLK